LKLPFDGLVGLAVAGIAGIDDNILVRHNR